MKLLTILLLLLSTITGYSQVKNNDELICPIPSEPTFPFGNDSLFKFIYAKINIPKEYEQTFWESSGRIIVNFNIEKNGKISGVKILKSMPNFPKLDKEVIKAIRKLPKWYPATQNGKPVKVHYILPIRFNYELIR